jgi:hypothetical protein
MSLVGDEEMDDANLINTSKETMYVPCVCNYLRTVLIWEEFKRQPDACHDDVFPCFLESVVAYIHVGGAGCQLSRRDPNAKDLAWIACSLPVIRARSFISSPAVFSSQDLERRSVSLHDGSEASFTGSTYYDGFIAGSNPSFSNWDFM